MLFYLNPTVQRQQAIASFGFFKPSIEIAISAKDTQVYDERRGEIYGEDGQPELWPEGRELIAPSLDIYDGYAPYDTGETPAKVYAVEAVTLEMQIEAIEAAAHLANLISADKGSRIALLAQIAEWQSQENDAQMCGLSCDWTTEIEEAKAEIRAIDERLFLADPIGYDASTILH
ncbi:hypothetical protein EON80_23210 [bacterium]|nr:MAG: hypothetical protein EON80_23210 [bacterium]